MTTTPESPVETLRRAAEAAPKVLPAGVGEAAATMFDLLRQWSGIPATVVAGGASLADEVLALAVQQQTQRDAAVRLVAENQLRRYDNEFNASHLRWQDFEGSAREDINALSAAGLLRTAPEPQQGVTTEQVELLREIAARLTSHGDSIANLHTAVDARPIWEAARDLTTITDELGAQNGEQ